MLLQFLGRTLLPADGHRREAAFLFSTLKAEPSVNPWRRKRATPIVRAAPIGDGRFCNRDPSLRAGTRLSELRQHLPNLPAPSPGIVEFSQSYDGLPVHSDSSLDLATTMPPAQSSNLTSGTKIAFGSTGSQT